MLMICHSNAISSLLHFPPTTSKVNACRVLSLGPAQALTNTLRLGPTQCADPKCAHLSPTPQPLQSHSHLPGLLTFEYEDVALTFLITDGGAKKMESAVVAILLFKVSSVRSFVVSLGVTKITAIEWNKGSI